MANGGLRINKPMKARYSPGYLARRARKREDRATFRQQTQQGFSELSNGLRTIDYAVVGVYEAFVNFRTVQLALDIAYVVTLLLATAIVGSYVAVIVGGVAYAALLAHLYSIRRRAQKAKEQAYLAALQNAQRQHAELVDSEPPVVEKEASDVATN